MPITKLFIFLFTYKISLKCTLYRALYKAFNTENVQFFMSHHNI